ncbi:hypothetical protein GGH96_003958 [Coemansia sp. RSA 1972]|nr:hypothetical protein GGH96_003958 [Coemansia sp. RSA 1972]
MPRANKDSKAAKRTCAKTIAKIGQGSPARRHQLTAQELQQLAPIPETLRPGLDVLFVGINPGVVSGVKQLHFGNPQNFFWPGLFQSGLIPEAIQPEDGHRLAAEWNMSIVNLVQRTTPSTSDLSGQEMRDAVPELCRKISANPPHIICFVGKGIYEIFVGSSKITLGLQDSVYDLDALLDGSHGPPLRQRGSIDQSSAAYLFVMPSTSGRTAAYQNPVKLQYFQQLKYVRDCATSASTVNDEHLDTIGPQTRSKYFQT